jgi:hypothetical protein
MFPRILFLFLFPITLIMGGGAFASLFSIFMPVTRPDFETIVKFGILLPAGLLGTASYLLWKISRYAIHRREEIKS